MSANNGENNAGNNNDVKATKALLMAANGVTTLLLPAL